MGLILPIHLIYSFGIIKGLILWILPRFLHGKIFYFFSQISHINETSFKNIKKTQYGEWAVHQIESTIDYNCDSYFVSFLSVGLNNQSIHHLFPSIHPCHYPKIHEILNQISKKYKIKRVVYDSMFEAFSKHLEHLGNCNDKDN
jgi:fatty acid desaturase